MVLWEPTRGFLSSVPNWVMFKNEGNSISFTVSEAVNLELDGLHCGHHMRVSTTKWSVETVHRSQYRIKQKELYGVATQQQIGFTCTVKTYMARTLFELRGHLGNRESSESFFEFWRWSHHSWDMINFCLPRNPRWTIDSNRSWCTLRWKPKQTLQFGFQENERGLKTLLGAFGVFAFLLLLEKMVEPCAAATAIIASKVEKIRRQTIDSNSSLVKVS